VSRTATAKHIADLVKEEGVRDRIGAQTSVYTGLISVVSRSSKPSFAKQQALRAIGNLCYDHDENRARFAAAGGVGAIIAALEALQAVGGGSVSAEDRVMCVGAILNTIAYNDILAGRFVEGGAIPPLVWLIRTAQSHREKELAFGSLSHLAACRGALAQMVGSGMCPLLVDELLASDASDSADDVIELLRGIAGMPEAAAKFESAEMDRKLRVLLSDNMRPEVAQAASLVLASKRQPPPPPASASPIKRPIVSIVPPSPAPIETHAPGSSTAKRAAPSRRLAKAGGIVAAAALALALLIAVIVLAVLLSKSRADNESARAVPATPATPAAAGAADACAGVWPTDRRECDYIVVGAGPAVSPPAAKYSPPPGPLLP
jgi:hypothetical protein